MNPEPTHQPDPHNNHNQQAPSMHALSTETTNPYSRIRLFFDAHKTQLWAAIISGILVLVISCLVLSTLVLYHHGKDGNSWDFRPLISSITFSAIAWISMKYRQNRILKSAAGQDSNIETTSALSLFETIALWTLLSLTAYTLLAAIWGEGAVSERLFSGWRIKSSPEITPLERIKTTLTTVGGIGGVSFLVIKFRQQDIAEKQHKHSEEERIKAEEAEINRKFDAEKLEANKKLVDAVQQLGDQSPQVRIAGVYALADVAGTYGSENHGVDYNKRAVEILCGYLRTVRSEDDKPVESAVLSILSSHLTPSTNSLHNNISPWSRYTIDLRGAKLTEAVNFDFAQISRLDCHATEFFGEVSLEECQLGNASFQDAIFEKTSKKHHLWRLILVAPTLNRRQSLVQPLRGKSKGQALKEMRILKIQDLRKARYSITLPSIKLISSVHYSWETPSFKMSTLQEGPTSAIGLYLKIKPTSMGQPLMLRVSRMLFLKGMSISDDTTKVAQLSSIPATSRALDSTRRLPFNAHYFMVRPNFIKLYLKTRLISKEGIATRVLPPSKARHIFVPQTSGSTPTLKM